MGSIPPTDVQCAESARCGARGIVVRSASAGSPIHTHTKESSSATGYELTLAVRGMRFCPGTYTQVPVVS